MDSLSEHSVYILILDGVQECLLIDSILMNTQKGKIDRASEMLHGIMIHLLQLSHR